MAGGTKSDEHRLHFKFCFGLTLFLSRMAFALLLFGMTPEPPLWNDSFVTMLF